MAVKKKRVKAVVKLQLAAGKANPGPPVGTALGPQGVPPMEFCNQFNAATKSQEGFVLPVIVTVYDDRTFTFILKKPPMSNLIKKELGIEKGSAAPNKQKVGKLTQDQLKKIAEIKLPDLNTQNIDAAMKIVAGTAINMGVEVEA